MSALGKPPPDVIYFAQGGMFAAAPDAVRRVPKEKYEWIAAQIARGHEELVFFLELSWWYLFGGSVCGKIATAGVSPVRPLLPFLHHLGTPSKRQLADGYVPYTVLPLPYTVLPPPLSLSPPHAPPALPPFSPPCRGSRATCCCQ